MDEALSNQKITDVRQVEDYWQIETEDFVISIYNPTYYTNMGSKEPISVLDANITGQQITNIIYVHSKVLILYLGKGLVNISLKNEDYKGPEAVYVSEKNGSTMIKI